MHRRAECAHASLMRPPTSCAATRTNMRPIGGVTPSGSAAFWQSRCSMRHAVSALLAHRRGLEAHQAPLAPGGGGWADPAGLAAGLWPQRSSPTMLTATPPPRHPASRRRALYLACQRPSTPYSPLLRASACMDALIHCTEHHRAHPLLHASCCNYPRPLRTKPHACSAYQL